MNHRLARGFSLLELLMVIAIIICLSALATPAVSSLLRGLEMNQAEQMLVGQLNFARQFAASRNRTVEVRFYRFPDATLPDGKFRAMQLFQYDDEGRSSPIEKVQRLPKSVIMNSSPTLSPLLDTARTKQWTPIDGQPSLSIGENYETRIFHFNPDGMTDLGFRNQWFLTMHGNSQSDTGTDLPVDHVVVSIDPINGHVRSYRP